MSITDNPPCPYCGGILIKKGFKHKKQCYICKDCGKYCTGENPKPVIKFKDINTDVHCPYCGSMDLTTSGFSKRGLRVYRCPSCNKRFTEETKLRLNNKCGKDEVCPRCGSTNIVGKGYNRIGYRRYRCKDCGRSYTKNVKLIYNEVRRRPVLSEENKRLVLMYKLNLGLKNKEIAEHFNCSVYAIQQLVKLYYRR